MSLVIGPLDASARDVLSLYIDAPRRTRLRLALRWRTCPYTDVAAALPPGADVLEVGCGQGLFCNWLAHTGRPVTGVDVDADKIAVAQAAAGRAARSGCCASFALGTPGWVPTGPWDVIVIVDVLYLLSPSAQHQLLASCASQLTDGGTVVVKTMAPFPRWKAIWDRLQEHVAVRILRMTVGDPHRPVTPDRLAEWLRDEGLDVTELSLHAGYPHPHHLLVARR
jgi:2-polyprenyl-3-methyl-5-hydroxy-6-metoxy-1,4-benzoquinol methylase